MLHWLKKNRQQSLKNTVMTHSYSYNYHIFTVNCNIEVNLKKSLQNLRSTYIAGLKSKLSGQQGEQYF